MKTKTKIYNKMSWINRISRNCLGMIVLILFPALGFAQTDSAKKVNHYEFTVQQAVDYAKKNNIAVKNALLDIQIQEQANREVTSAAYPQIKGSASLIYNYKVPISLVPAEVFGGPAGTFQKLSFGVKYNTTAGIELNQLLFDGQVFVGLQARKTIIDFQSKRAEITEEFIKTNIYKIYYQLVVSKKQIELIDANIARFDKLLHDTKEIYKAGFNEQLDIDKVSVGLTNLQTERTKALNQIANGYIGLKVLMGMPVADELVLTDPLNEADIQSGILESSSFKFTDRKEYQFAELGAKLGEYNIKRYQLSKIPTLSLNAYYNQNTQDNKLRFNDWFPISAVSLRINVPIFSGFATDAKIQRTRLELKKINNAKDSLAMSITGEIETAKNNFNSAISSMNYQRKNMQVAEKVYEQTKKKYEIGTGSQTEINAAQTELKQAQTNYIQALYDAIIARVDFLKATGKL